MTRDAARTVERTWFVGCCLYIAGAIVLVMAQILLPAVGALIFLGCTIATSDIDESLGRWLLAAFAVQSALALFVLVGPRHSTLGGILTMLAVMGPLIAAAVVTRIVRRRATANQEL